MASPVMHQPGIGDAAGLFWELRHGGVTPGVRRQVMLWLSPPPRPIPGGLSCSCGADSCSLPFRSHTEPCGCGSPVQQPVMSGLQGPPLYRFLAFWVKKTQT